MKRNAVETIAGFIVILVAIVFVIISYKTGVVEVSKGDTYILKANFERIDGIDVGSDVKISGIKIGKVIRESLDYETYNALVEMAVYKEIKLPSDTAAEILTNGLLGEKYINLVPGAETSLLKNHDIIEFTQSSINIESLIGKMLFGGSGELQEEKGESESTSPAVAEEDVPRPNTHNHQGASNNTSHESSVS